MSKPLTLKPWGTPTEVSMQELPAGKRTDPQRLAFYEDALRRLEMTPVGKVLRYEFGDYQTAQKYRDFVANRANKHLGKDKVKLSVTKLGGGSDAAVVYVYRGPAWGRDAMP